MPLYDIIPQAKLPRNVSGAFTYDSSGSLPPGSLVAVEFRKKTVLGLVLGTALPLAINKNNPSPPLVRTRIKSVKKIISAAPAYFPLLIKWFATYYFSSQAFSWQTMTPRLPKQIDAAALKTITNPILGTGWKKIIGSSYTGLKIAAQNLPLIQQVLKNRQTSVNTYQFNTDACYVIYLKLIEYQLQQKQTTILLTPTVANLKILLTYLPPRWSDQIVMMSSDIYPSKTRHWRHWQFINAASNPLIIIGTRSAIFAPCQNLGLIIIDKADSIDYKQADQNPRYDARQVALKISELTQCEIRIFADGLFF